MKIFTKGTWQNTLWRTIVAIAAFGVPLATLAIPHWQDLTLGAIVFGIVHFAEGKLAK